MNHMSRRSFLKSLALTATGAVVAACGATPTPTPLPKPTAAPAATATAAPKPVTLKWWSHWAEEENKKTVLQTAADDYMKAKPNVKIEFTWWQKAEMFVAFQNAMQAGSGFPDIMYLDVLPQYFEAGWIEDLGPHLDWKNAEPGGKAFWTRPGPGGKEGAFAVPIEASKELVITNPAIFQKAGVTIPASFQFTADEFFEAGKKIRAAGFDMFAQGIGDRTYPGQVLYRFMLWSALGQQGFDDLFNGKTSWNTPEVKAVLEYCQKVAAIPAYSAQFTTLKLAEAHQYFHTQQKAAMFLVGAWYTGRAFVAPDKGGQPKDFRLSFLKYPSWPNGKGNAQMQGNYGGGVGVMAKSPNKDVAVDFMKTLMTVKYGNLWVSKTAVPTGFVTDASTMPASEYGWYFAEFEKVHKGVDWALTKNNPCGDLNTVYNDVLNQMPLRPISVDDYISKVETARKKPGCGGA